MANNGESRFITADLVIRILLFLPARSLLRFKRVCKTWYNLIQNPNFITDHCNRSNNYSRLLAIDHQLRWSPDFAILLDASISLPQVKIVNPLPLVFNGRAYTDLKHILGPVNGIYLMQYSYFLPNRSEDRIALWNPSTSEFRQLKFPSFESLLPVPPQVIFPCRSWSHFGIGSTDDDLIVVCISSFNSIVVSLYSLVRDCWKQIDFDPTVVHKFMEIRDSACTNGVYYWLSYSFGYHIILFDMRTEAFREVPLPNEYLDWYIDAILVRNNSIVLSVTHFGSNGVFATWVVNCVDIWELKGETYWSKIFSFVPLFPYAKPLRFWKDDEIIFRGNNGKLFLYNVRVNETRNLGIDAVFGVLGYEESVASVKGGRSIDIDLTLQE